MTVIQLETQIAASIDTCFDVSRDIGIHILSTGKTREIAVAGRTSGLCELGDMVTWEATHFGIRQRLSVKITGLRKPYFFEDTMLKGAFRHMRHEHHFREEHGITIMKDHFEYEVPFGILGKLFNSLVLNSYMTRFLLERNKVIRSVAEQKSKIQKAG